MATKTAAGLCDPELVAKLALLGRADRAAYRKLRAMLWRLVKERSPRSERPSN